MSLVARVPWVGHHWHRGKGKRKEGAVEMNIVNVSPLQHNQGIVLWGRKLTTLIF